MSASAEAASTSHYPKGIARRTAILDTVLEMLEELPAGRPTFREISQRAGIVESGVIRYFGTMDALFVAALDRRDEVAVRDFSLTSEDEVGVQAGGGLPAHDPA